MERRSSSSGHSQAGTITLMGSGELTESMTRVHQWVVSRIDGPVNAVFLDTPAGFELNADAISERARNYVRRYVGVPCGLASFKSARNATSAELKNALRKIEQSNYIFAGPGSPTYVIKQWSGTPFVDTIVRRIDRGAHLVLASAAAISVGHYSLPVYEIYKVGDDPHWVDGLNLLGRYGLDLTIIPHWNNSEGGSYDTRFCFIGKPRFDALEALLPESTVILGIDEYTACVLVPGEERCRIMGAGGVTICRRGREKTHQAGSSFGLDEFRVEPRPVGAPVVNVVPQESPDQISEDLAHTLGETERTLTAAPKRGRSELAGQAYELMQAIERAEASGAGDQIIGKARDELRRLVGHWGKEIGVEAHNPVAEAAPYVELLISLRTRLRSERQWALADEIRDGLAAQGIVLEDTPEGTTWHRG